MGGARRARDPASSTKSEPHPNQQTMLVVKRCLSSRHAMLLRLIILSVWSIAAALNCTHCNDDLERMRIEEIKMTILRELGLTAPPNIDRSMLPSAELREEYRKLAEQTDGSEFMENELDKSTLFIPSSTGSSYDLAYFDISERLAGRKLVEARLSVYINNSAISSEFPVHIRVFSINGTMNELIAEKSTFFGTNTQRIGINLPLDSISLDAQKIHVSAMHAGKNLVVHNPKGDHERMILQLTVASRASRRRRMATPVCTIEAPSNGCCLYNLIVDFETIGWDWIIAPPRYNAYICRGDCRINSHHYQVHETGHRKIMKAAMRMGDKAKKLLESVTACCHPTDYRYDTMKLAYVNRDGRVSVAHVNGMIARKCACT